MSTSDITVSAERDYHVRIGAGLLGQSSGYEWAGNYERILLIHPDGLTSLAKRVAVMLEENSEVTRFVHPDGEAGKDVSILAAGWEAAAEAGIGRRDLMVGVGGGATTDLAGFIAATWLRGVDVAHIPTTLLAMVDAAVGGKTGINTPTGKNLAGAFHSPVTVVCDTDTLTSLPSRDFTAGLAEIIKCGCIADPEILDLVAANPRLDARSAAVQELIERSVAVKANVVSSDLKEAGMREILNYGHTLGHAIEKLSHYQVRHGEAVAIGCVYAAHVAQVMGYTNQTWIERQVRLFAKHGLPTSWKYPQWEQVVQVMRADKKVRSAQIRMVLCPRPGATRVEQISPEALHEAAQEMGIIA